MKNIKIDSTKILIFLVLLAVILIPGRFGWDSLNVLNNEAEQIRSEAARYDTQAQEAEDAVLSDQEAFEARMLKAETAIPQELEVPAIINVLSGEAAASNLIWLSGTPTSSPETGGLGGASTLVISVRTADGTSGSATVTSVGNFLDRIRTLDRLVVVDRVNLNASEGTATIEVRFFSQESDS